MAITKNITAPNGVPLTYHRVVSVNCIKGVQNIIEVASYVSAAARAGEAEAIANQVAEQNVYIETNFVNAPYDPEMTYTDAYEYIKSIEPYNDGNDKFEDGNDPVAVAMSQAKDGVFVSELILPKPANKVGFLTVPRIKSLGYEIVWEFEPDPNYNPDQPDGSYLKPYPFEDGMTVEAGKWYTDGDDIWEALKSGIPAGFTDPEFFDII